MVFSNEQIAQLERVFEKEKYITREERIKLSIKTKLDEHQIRVWFQNKRTFWKKSEGVTKKEVSAIYKTKLSGVVPTLVKPRPTQETKLITEDGLVFIDKLWLFKN